MTLLEIEMLIHYAVSPTDYRDGDFNAPAVRGAITRFNDSEYQLLRPKRTSPPVGLEYRPGAYEITERGRAYVEALKVRAAARAEMGHAR